MATRDEVRKAGFSVQIDDTEGSDRSVDSFRSIVPRDFLRRWREVERGDDEHTVEPIGWVP